MTEKPYACAGCTKSSCLRADFEHMPNTCPTLTHPEVSRDAGPYQEPGTHAQMVSADGTPFTPEGQKRNRVEELAQYAKSQGMASIGIAFCVSLTKEAQQLGRLLRKQGFATELVCCRVGSIDYNEIDLPKAHPENFAAICNPVAQARLLNARKVELIAQVGLCIGHDLILQRECDAPVTTVVVKDRALDHHSVVALR